MHTYNYYVLIWWFVSRQYYPSIIRVLSETVFLPISSRIFVQAFFFLFVHPYANKRFYRFSKVRLIPKGFFLFVSPGGGGGGGGGSSILFAWKPIKTLAARLQTKCLYLYTHTMYTRTHIDCTLIELWSISVWKIVDARHPRIPDVFPAPFWKPINFKRNAQSSRSRNSSHLHTREYGVNLTYVFRSYVIIGVFFSPPVPSGDVYRATSQSGIVNEKNYIVLY